MLPETGLSAMFGGGLTGGAGGSAGPSTARGGDQGGASFDASGMNVIFGGGSIDSNRTQTPLPGIDGALSGIGQYLPYIAIGFVALVLWKKTRKKT